MIKNEELINILKALGFEWYGFENSTDGSGNFIKVIRNKEEWYYINVSYFTDEWQVLVRNCEKNNEGKLTFKDNEVSLEDINSLIRLCKINLVLEQFGIEIAITLSITINTNQYGKNDTHYDNVQC